MKLFYRISLFLLLGPLCYLQAQTVPGTISGTVISSGQPVPFANVGIKGTRWGSTTNENGFFEIEQLPYGAYEIIVSYIGYEKGVKRLVLNEANPSAFVSISIKQVLKTLDEIVVTGTRTEKRRLDSAVPVNVIDSRILESTQSLTLSEGLTFQPGIRVEKDCQTCNYSQVRINGMAGSYSQILINSRPLLSSMAGLYGLEQIPTSLIERVEIVRGGGSVMYGSSAIGGTINIITRDAAENSLELTSTGSLINGEAGDLQTDLFASLQNKSRNGGASLMVSKRNKEAWDANGDGFSELASLENLSFGLNTFYKPSPGSKIRLGLNSINEIRNGGDQLSKDPHLRLQSEWRDSRIIAANVDFSKELYKLRSRFDVYAAVQKTDRNHYTGAYGADGYGTTDNETVIGGLLFNHTLLNFISGKNVLTTGLEYQYDYVLDEIKTYNYLIRQETFQPGFFLQSDWDIFPKLNLVSGIRFSQHNKESKTIVSPRFNLLYKVNSKLQVRAGRSTGFRAPQAFDTDMHLAFAGGGITLTTIDPNLRSEKSVSYTGSVDYNVPSHTYIYGVTLSGFHTVLRNAFILEQSESMGGNTILNRTNGSNATVKGITFEARANYNYIFEADLGVTFQSSSYEKPVSWSNAIEGSTKFLRTPDWYGYFSFTYSGLKKVKLSTSGVYTGPMMVPHFAGAPGVTEDEVISSKNYVEVNFRVELQVFKSIKRIKLLAYAGVQNLLNDFQSDFDRGPDRDSNFMYGPGRPRTSFLGLKVQLNGSKF